MTQTAVGPTIAQRWRTARWVVLALVVISALAALSTYLTAPRPGGDMDAESTSSDGAHALVTLLRERGVEVTVATDIGAVERAARPDSLVVIAQTFFLVSDDQVQRLAKVPGDRLLVEPATRTREALAPEIRSAKTSTFGGAPGCDLRAATQAGVVQFGASATYEAVSGADVTRCYEGAVARYTDRGRTVTTVGTADFMSNGGLLKQGNAALAMNLAGARSHVIWYAPQRLEGESGGTARVSDLIPDQVIWVVIQLAVVVALLAFWKARRIGPLVAEKLPVVVRASETVEGRGRLYRARRARDQSADALRTATLQRLVPRLGVGAGADPSSVVSAVAARTGSDPAAVGHTLYGPPPTADDDLVHLAHQLDDIERQVARS